MLPIDVLFAPVIVHNLVSIRKLTKCKQEVRFKSIGILIINDNGIVFNEFINENLYFLCESMCANIY